MKKISIVFFVLLLALFVGMTTFIGNSEDFTEPVSMSQEEYGIDENSPIWNMTMDDLAQYFYEEGIIDSLEYGELSEGIATEARTYENLDLYWWDVKNLDENSAEYKAYMEMIESGVIDLWDSGNMMSVTPQGPYGIWIQNYTGDIDELLEIYHAFGTE